MQEQQKEIQCIKPEDWIALGYRKSPVNPILDKNADYILQKLFSDDAGKRYYLTVYVYENYKKDYYLYYNAQYGCASPMYSYTPDVQFSPEGKCTVNVQLLMDRDSTIDSVESQVYDLWVMIGAPYCEKWS